MDVIILLSIVMTTTTALMILVMKQTDANMHPLLATTKMLAQPILVT
jgi:hypothetical protein